MADTQDNKQKAQEVNKSLFVIRQNFGDSARAFEKVLKSLYSLLAQLNPAENSDLYNLVKDFIKTLSQHLDFVETVEKEIDVLRNDYEKSADDETQIKKFLDEVKNLFNGIKTCYTNFKNDFENYNKSILPALQNFAQPVQKTYFVPAEQAAKMLTESAKLPVQAEKVPDTVETLEAAADAFIKDAQNLESPP
ncbi:hypothetical protein B6U93_00920 [Candidatus Woesearchaeota archaeon ex4484_78]|nr:MAG: hypothetical protein B6U93_00920 [Candidatus Woesearchaeota archaeon ex4484_78]